MRLRQCKRLLVNVASDVGQNNIFSFAAALSYYFVLAFFPALIALATIVGHLPIPNLFNTIVEAMARVLPHPAAWDWYPADRQRRGLLQ